MHCEPLLTVPIIEFYAMNDLYILVRVLRSECCSITRITDHFFSRNASP